MIRNPGVPPVRVVRVAAQHIHGRVRVGGGELHGDAAEEAPGAAGEVRERGPADLAAGRGPDGFRVDTDGNVWSSSGPAIYVFAAEGDVLGKINFPQNVSNLVFGGPKRNRLFVTCTHELYSVFVTATGVARP